MLRPESVAAKACTTAERQSKSDVLRGKGHTANEVGRIVAGDGTVTII